MSTPNWKKNFIVIFGLFENLIFGGTLLGWSALNNMLKSEGVYQNVCPDINPNNLINHYNYSMTQKNPVLIHANNTQNLNIKFSTDKTMNSFNKSAINLLLIDSHNDKNITLLEQFEAYYMETTLSPIYVSYV